MTIGTVLTKNRAEILWHNNLYLNKNGFHIYGVKAFFVWKIILDFHIAEFNPFLFAHYFGHS